MDYDAHLAFRGYQAGAVDYLTKPFDPWILRSKIKVFVDLWRLHEELAEQASRHASLRHTLRHWRQQARKMVAWTNVRQSADGTAST